MKWTGIILLLTWLIQAPGLDHMPAFYKADTSPYHLKGNVAQVRQLASFSDNTDVLFLSNPGLIGFEPVKELILQFDSSGNLTYSKEITIKAGKKKDEANTESFYIYTNGLLNTKTIRENSRETDSIVFNYDRYKRVSSYLSYDSKGRSRYKYTFTYNSRQQLTTIRRKNEENFPVEMIKLRYDSNGHLAEQQFFDDNMRKVRVIDYDNHPSDSAGLYNKSILAYNESGRLISGEITINTQRGLLLEKSIIDSAKKVIDYRVFRYNDHDDIEEEKLFANMEDIKVNYKYTYDENGNWTEKVVSVNDSIAGIITRTIEYFK